MTAADSPSTAVFFRVSRTMRETAMRQKSGICVAFSSSSVGFFTSPRTRGSLPFIYSQCDNPVEGRMSRAR